MRRSNPGSRGSIRVNSSGLAHLEHGGRGLSIKLNLGGSVTVRSASAFAKIVRTEKRRRTCSNGPSGRSLAREDFCKPPFQRGDSIGKVVAAHSQYPPHNWISSARKVKHSRFFLFALNVPFDEMVDAAEIADQGSDLRSLPQADIARPICIALVFHTGASMSPLCACPALALGAKSLIVLEGRCNTIHCLSLLVKLDVVGASKELAACFSPN
jgi:hypothetical protein